MRLAARWAAGAGLAGKRRPKPSQVGELSSTSELLRGMRLPGGKFPGERVIKETRKAEGSKRLIVLYGGRTLRSSKRELAAMARDRGFDLSHQRFLKADAATRASMIQGSLRWQEKAKARWMGRLEKRAASVKSPQKRARILGDRDRLATAPVASPHTGARPVSSYLRRYWA